MRMRNSLDPPIVTNIHTEYHVLKKNRGKRENAHIFEIYSFYGEL